MNSFYLEIQNRNSNKLILSACKNKGLWWRRRAHGAASSAELLSETAEIHAVQSKAYESKINVLENCNLMNKILNQKEK